ncbi:MAG: 2,3-bisphosphoglycerate-independent phosphoglycerate mutase [Methanophagales archaeon]|nr:2,3-bisphosphoglycerate-independent phosphoglycerate mutase [Methanophagales archaeon]
MRIAIKSNLSSYKNKVILLVCDGLGDRPYQPADGKTPLQAAYTPNLDAISEAGINGLIDIISPGIVPGSDTAHLSLFGYDPYRYYPGRGVFEALGADMELQKGDVAFRANFATVDANMRIKDRRAGRKGSKELAEVLNGLEIDGVKILLENTTDHRCAVVMRSNGGTLSRYVSDVDTHEAGGVIQKCEPLNEAAVDGEGGSDGEGARKTASIVNRFIKMSYELLDEHPVNAARREKGELPANIVLLRGAGSFKRVIPVKERFGFSAACIAGVSLYSGVAKYLGMDVLAHRYAGEMLDTDTDLQNKAEAALQALKEHDFVFVHVKDSDNYGHDGDFEGKKNIISRIDKELVARLKDADAYIAVTGDHSTPVSLKRHSSDPVPLVIKGDGVRKDNVKKFDEFSVAYGGLGRIKGTDLMPILSDFMGFYMMYGT